MMIEGDLHEHNAAKLTEFACQADALRKRSNEWRSRPASEHSSEALRRFARSSTTLTQRIGHLRSARRFTTN